MDKTNKTNDSQPSMDWVCGELQCITVDEQMIADVLQFQRSSEGGVECTQ